MEFLKMAMQVAADEEKRLEAIRTGRPTQPEPPTVKAQEPAPAPRGGKPRLPYIETVSVQELLRMKFPEPRWLVPGLLPVGLTLLAGKSKVGKSWLALQLAQAVATGGRFLGIPVPRGRVLYFALEDAQWRLQDRTQKQGWPNDDDGVCEFVPIGKARELIPLNRRNAERMAEVIEAGSFSLVIVDTISRMFQGDQNDASHVTQALGPLQEVALRLGVAILLLEHHNKLSQGDDLDPVLAILGSTAKGAVADTIWGLFRQRGKAGAVFAVTGRDIRDARYALRWDALTSSWQCEGNADQLELTERQQELLETLRSLGTATVSELAKAVGADRANTYRRLNELCDAGLIKRVDIHGVTAY